MATILSGGAARGLADASVPLKSAQTALGIYQYAKAKKDDDLMERAVLHMSKSINSVKRETEASKNAQDEHMRQERVRDRLKNSAETSVEPQGVEKASKPEDGDSFDYAITDTVEISPKALALQKNTERVTPQRGTPLIYTASSKPGMNIEIKKLQLDMLG